VIKTTNFIRQKALSMCAFSLMALLGGGVNAQSFPSQQVKFVSPYPAGSGGDAVGRILADKLRTAWNQPVVVDSRPGANGFLAIGAVKNVITPGHDFLLADMGHLAIAPTAFRKLPYDPEKDLVPVTTISKAPLFVAVGTGSPYKSLADLVTASKGGTLSYASPGVGSFMQLGAEQFASAIGSKMLHVPFRDNSQMATAIAAGDVNWFLATYATTQAMVKAGKIRLLAVADVKRSTSAPEVPTLQEAGGPTISASAWLVLMGPTGTPQTTIEKVNTTIAAVLTDGDIIKRFEVMGLHATASSPNELSKLIASERGRYGEVIKHNGISLD
jgi:tripartite-type tricarboxylate transporter receptor subunit TctC